MNVFDTMGRENQVNLRGAFNFHEKLKSKFFRNLFCFFRFINNINFINVKIILAFICRRTITCAKVDNRTEYAAGVQNPEKLFAGLCKIRWKLNVINLCTNMDFIVAVSISPIEIFIIIIKFSF